MLRTASTVTFACYSKVCAPPPAGKGGSVKGGSSGRMPSDPEEIRATLTSMFEGFSHNGVRVSDVTTKVLSTGKVIVRMNLLDSDGEKVGDISRRFDPHSPDEIEHDWMVLQRHIRGQGLGAAFLRHSVKQYRRLGINKVVTYASSTPGESGMIGAAVWGKLGFDFHGREQRRLAEAMQQYNESRGFGEPEAFSKSLRRAVSRGTASIKDVMKADPGDFLNSECGLEVGWDGTLLLDEVTLTAAAALTLSYAEWADAEERYLRPRSSTSAGSLVAACYSRACAPPSAGGTGGSLPRGAAGSAPRAAAKSKTPKGVSEKTAALMEAKFTPTEFTKQVQAAIDAEPALKNIKSLAQQRAERDALHAEKTKSWTDEWSEKLRNAPDGGGGLVATENVKYGSPPGDPERAKAVTRQISEMVLKMIDDPSFVPSTPFEKSVRRFLDGKMSSKYRDHYGTVTVENEDGTTTSFSVVFGTKWPRPKKGRLRGSEITAETEAASTRVGSIVKMEILRRTAKNLAETRQPDWDAIEAERQRLSAEGGEVKFWINDWGVHVAQEGRQSSTSEPDPPHLAAFKKMIEDSGMRSEDRKRHDLIVQMDAEAKAFKSVMYEVRSMGGPISGTPAHRKNMRGEPSSHELVVRASRSFPSDWIAASNEMGEVSFRGGVKRAHYNEDKTEVTLDGTVGTTVHEFTHRMEHVMIDVRRMEAIFFERRTGGGKGIRLDQLQPGRGFNSSEVALPDKFFDPYCGKVYPGDSYFELMSMGLEVISNGHRKSKNMDEDYTNFVLGVLTVFGREE